jgi:putative ABC transport system substrate-binding protein
MTNSTRRALLVQGGAFLFALGSGAASAAAPERVFRVGVLTPSVRAAPNYDGLFDELRLLGLIEGKNPIFDQRGFAAGFAQFPQLAAELVKADVDAILCGGDAAIRAAQQATTTVPIIGVTDDFIGAGLVRSLPNPGSNTTGISMLASELDGKRQQILIDLLPNIHHMAALADVNTTPQRQLEKLETAARDRGIALATYRVANPDEVVPAIMQAKADGAEALNVLGSPLFNITQNEVIARAEALRLPTMHHTPEMAAAGGLIAYGPRFSQIGRLQARLLAKVLRGARPSDLPVELPTTFELAINLKVANAIGVKIPRRMITLADEVLE